MSVLVPTSSSTSAWCGDCRATQVFERPACADGHDADCPEWICTACGYAWVELVTTDAPARLVRRAVA